MKDKISLSLLIFKIYIVPHLNCKPTQMVLLVCWIYISLRRYTGPFTVAMAIAARLGVNIAANIGFQYAAEMLPTVVRAQGVSLIHIIGYFAHIIGPYVVYLVSISREMMM